MRDATTMLAMPERQIFAARVGEADLAAQPLDVVARGEALDRVGEVAIGAAIAGDDAADERQHALVVERLHRARDRAARAEEVEHDERARPA